MRRYIVVLLPLALAAGCSSVQNANIDYARSFDFDGVETFQYVDTEESNIQDNPLMADRVVSMIKQELREGGLQEVQENPDLYVTYHFTSEERKQLSTTSMGMGGYGGYWDDWGGWGGYGGFYGGFWPRFYEGDLSEIDFEYIRDTSYEETAVYGEVT